MRPTVIRLIAGCFLGAALSVSLMLPGFVVLPDQAPIQHLGLPAPPAATVVRATAVSSPRPRRAPAPRQVRRFYAVAPTVRTVPISRVIPRAPTRSHRPRPVAPPRLAAQTLTTLGTPSVDEAQGSTSVKEEKQASKAEKKMEKKSHTGGKNEQSSDDGKKKQKKEKAKGQEKKGGQKGGDDRAAG